MQKRETTWIAVLLVLGVGYYHFFGGRYAPRALAVHASLRPARRGDSPVYPVYFSLNDDLKLKSVKVVPLNDDGQIDPATVPCWSLVEDGTPIPIRAFFYGQAIKGMKSTLTNTQPDALTPGVIYQMTLVSGKQTATLNFKTEPTR